MMNNIEKAVEELKKVNEVVILTHANPDGDTLGCGFALMRALKSQGKRVMLLNEDKIGAKFGYMLCPNDEVDVKNAYVIAVDVADTKLLGKDTENVFDGKIQLCIDHHGTNKNYANATILDASCSAACELMYKFIKAMGVEIDKEIADCLYTGISTDSGCFRYSNVTAETHRIAAELIALGADHAEINRIMFETKTREELELEKLCLEGMTYYCDGKVALIALTQEMYKKSGADESFADAITSIPRQVAGAKIGITLKEKCENVYKISVRTHEPYDASQICGKLGGGGHNRAAGCRVEGSLEEVKNTIIETVKLFI